MNRFNDYKSNNGIRHQQPPRAISGKVHTTPLSEAIKENFQPGQTDLQPGASTKQPVQQQQQPKPADTQIAAKQQRQQEKKSPPESTLNSPK